MMESAASDGNTFIVEARRTASGIEGLQVPPSDVVMEAVKEEADEAIKNIDSAVN